MGWSDYFTVPKESFEKRLSICNECEEYDKGGKRCRKCGCFMEYKAKLRIVECPMGKWGKEEYKRDVTN